MHEWKDSAKRRHAPNKMNIKHRIVVGSFFAAFALSAFATAQADLVVLFDGNGLPSSQPWLAYGANSLTPTQTPQAGGVRLQSDLASSAGYSNYVFPNILKNNAFPTLSRSAGFELAFSLAVNSENVSVHDRQVVCAWAASGGRCARVSPLRR